MSTVTQTLYTSALLSKKTIAHDLLELRFEKPAGFVFKAGQFIQCQIPDGDKTTLRSYSISSVSSDPYIELCVKLVPDGKGSRFFTSLNLQESLHFIGPHGRFTNLQQNNPLVFVATGAGMAPIMSMIVDELQGKKTTAQVHLLFGVRSEEDVFWIERLDALAKQYSNFLYTLTLSQPSSAWAGLSGRVTIHIETTIISNADYYLCGSLEMVKDVRQILTTADIEMKKIHFEIF